MLSKQQIKVISSLVYESIKEGKRDRNGNRYISREHITHPLLSKVYVKMTAKELSQENSPGNDRKREWFGKDTKEHEVRKEKKLKILKIQIV